MFLVGSGECKVFCRKDAWGSFGMQKQSSLVRRPHGGYNTDNPLRGV